MKAVGLAGYAHLVHAPSLMKNARYQYLLALQSTNAALRDPIEVKRDATLLATIILGLFETITGVARRSLDDWAEHSMYIKSPFSLLGSAIPQLVRPCEFSSFKNFNIDSLHSERCLRLNQTSRPKSDQKQHRSKDVSERERPALAHLPLGWSWFTGPYGRV